MVIDSVSSLLADRLQGQREQMNMSMMKQRMQAAQAMAQMLMDAAENVEIISGSSSGIQGSIIDIYA